jgi:ADP-heptose:LPS heptosyltransferase
MATPPKKILLIQLRQLGDVLLTTPAAEVLKANFPGAEVHFLTEPPSDQLLPGNPFIDRVLVYDRRAPVKWLFKVRAEKYDLVVDFMSNPRSALLAFLSGAGVKFGPSHTASAWAYNKKFVPPEDTSPYAAFQKIDFLAALGLDKVFYPYPRLYPAEGDRLWAEGALDGLALRQKNTIAFAPASRRVTRQWPAEHYARLGAMAADRLKVNVLLLWGPGEKELAAGIERLAASPDVRLAPETKTLPRLSALLARTSLLVSNCSGTKHIAQASGTSTLGVYGSSRPENWTPPADQNHQTVRNETLDCVGCRKNDCPIAVKCLRELSPEAVFAKLVAMPTVKDLLETRL